MRYLQIRSEQMRVAQACHVDVTTGHCGIIKTVSIIKESFIRGSGKLKGYEQDLGLITLYAPKALLGHGQLRKTRDNICIISGKTIVQWR